MPCRLWNTILVEFPDVEFTTVAMALSRLIMPLGPEGVAAVRRSARIGEAMVDTAAAGVPESDVYAGGMAAGKRRARASDQTI